MFRQGYLYSSALLFFLITACSSGSDHSSGQIEYNKLDSLQTNLELEIGESENYLPGQLTSLVVAANGDILVTDWASKTIEQFSSDGNHIFTVAEQGEGPGEVGNYFYLRETASDTIIVSQMISQRDFFAPDAEGRYRFQYSEKMGEVSERSFRIMGAQSDTSYYASVLNVFRSGQMNETEQQDYRQTVISVINGEGKLLQDSVQTYKAANSLVERPSDNSIRVRSMPFRHDDDLALLPNGNYLIARIDSNAIYKYNRTHEVVKKIPLNVASRPITSDDMEYELGELDSGTRNKIEARTSDQKPPYLNVYATDEYIWLHTNTDEKGKEIVVIDYEGKPLGKFMLPEVDNIHKIMGNEIYTVHQSPEEGHFIRKYSVNLQ